MQSIQREHHISFTMIFKLSLPNSDEQKCSIFILTDFITELEDETKKTLHTFWLEVCLYIPSKCMLATKYAMIFLVSSSNSLMKSNYVDFGLKRKFRWRVSNAQLVCISLLHHTTCDHKANFTYYDIVCRCLYNSNDIKYFLIRNSWYFRSLFLDPFKTSSSTSSSWSAKNFSFRFQLFRSFTQIRKFNYNRNNTFH